MGDKKDAKPNAKQVRPSEDAFSDADPEAVTGGSSPPEWWTHAFGSIFNDGDLQ